MLDINSDHLTYYINTPLDINEHLTTLHSYALQCNHITEMGVRNVVSTWAFLYAKPKTIISYDITSSENIFLAYEYAKKHNIDFTFIQNNVLDIKIAPTELLFIDTLHQYKQLKQELNLHSQYVSKYIIFHDTSKFGVIDELTGQAGGLQPAIDEFLSTNSEWKLKERFTNNNGLTIIQRNNQISTPNN